MNEEQEECYHDFTHARMNNDDNLLYFICEKCGYEQCVERYDIQRDS